MNIRFKQNFTNNYANLVADCKSFAKDLIGTKYEFLLDDINPSLFSPEEIDINQCFEVMDALFNPSISGKLMDKTDYFGYNNHDIMFFNPMWRIFNYMSRDDINKINDIRLSRFLDFVNYYRKHGDINISDGFLFDEKHSFNASELENDHFEWPSYSLRKVSSFVLSAMKTTFEPRFQYDESSSTISKIIFKTRINEEFDLGLKFDFTHYKHYFSLRGHLSFPSQIDLFYSKAGSKLNPKHTIFLGKYQNPSLRVHDLDKIELIGRGLKYHGEKIEKKVYDMNSISYPYLPTSSIELNNYNDFIQNDSILKINIFVYFHLLKFSSQPYEKYIIDCLTK